MKKKVKIKTLKELSTAYITSSDGSIINPEDPKLHFTSWMQAVCGMEAEIVSEVTEDEYTFFNLDNFVDSKGNTYKAGDIDADLSKAGFAGWMLN